MRVSALIISLLLSACTTPPQVLGPYAVRLSTGDIKQIRLAAKRDLPNIAHVTKINVVRPDKAHVEATLPNYSGEPSSFDMIRRGDRWMLDPADTGAQARTVVVW